MKKIIVILSLIFVSFVSFGQEKEIIYKTSVNWPATRFCVAAECDSNGEVILKIDDIMTWGVASNYWVCGRTNYNKFVNDLIYIRNKYEEYIKIAEENNITNFKKDFYKLKGINKLYAVDDDLIGQIYSMINISESNAPHVEFNIDNTGNKYLKIGRRHVWGYNTFCTDCYFYINSLEDLDEIIDCLKDKYDEIKYLVNDNNRKDELFK